mmetsp:Transcript_26320/g.66379  ORF Transcript_26320/g.66379 Transcript_26320/m.66379 type:complete len:144 (+) Transcript_26320:407-838(+)
MDAKEEMQARQAAQMQAGQEEQMQQMQKAREAQEQRQDQKKMIIRQLLEPEALERLQRIALVKKEKADAIEEAIIAKVQSGAQSTKMDDNTLVRLIVSFFRYDQCGFSFRRNFCVDNAARTAIRINPQLLRMNWMPQARTPGP